MANSTLPPLPKHFEYRLNLARHVTPRLLKEQPVHRWFYFPHSFSPQLVELLLQEWRIEPGAVIVDPFVGAGTTMRAAQEMGVDCIGTDLSPLSVLVSNVKVGCYDPRHVEDVVELIQRSCSVVGLNDTFRGERLQRAFSDEEFSRLMGLRQAILCQSEPVRDLLLVALLRIQQSISRAVPDGGWFRWVERESSEDEIWPRFAKQVQQMLGDVHNSPISKVGKWQAQLYDARSIAELRSKQSVLQSGCQAIITSPPYPNRHDYSRVFQIELLTMGLQDEDVFALRHNSLRSHVEARPPEESKYTFTAPAILSDLLDSLPEKADRRIAPMLRGYFEDMAGVLYSAHELLASRGLVALVVGNVRHAGVMIPVDEILVEIGKTIGYEPQTSWVARLRGNSAQQMGKFGRVPARESVVILQKS